jgi:hypothetical protein
VSGVLDVLIPADDSFYTLYADGVFLKKSFDRDSRSTVLSYDENAVVFLYYTYPAHREACAVRNAPSDRMAAFPGLSKKVSPLFSVRGSRVDKLKRAAAFLNRNFGGAWSRGDGFYIRLYFLLSQRGRLNYAALRKLAEISAPHTAPHPSGFKEFNQ